MTINKKKEFDIFKLKGKLSKIRDWMHDHHFPPRLLFILMGIISTVWFLLRVIPKPSRAGYPCMQVAAPFMSGFVVYLLSIGGITLALRKARMNFNLARYLAAGSFLLVALVVMVISITNGVQNSYAATQTKTGPDDGPNQPIGKPVGVNPGRVVWVWNPDATNENCATGFDTQDWYWLPQNTDGKVAGSMFRDALNKLTGKSTVAESWDLLFHSFNVNKSQKNKGYTKGEKIFIKINQGTARWVLSQEDKERGYYFPSTLKPEEERIKGNLGATETTPYVVLEILRELVNELGIDQADIAVGDPMTHTYGHNYDIWFKEFPDVVYTDKYSDRHGRTLIYPSADELVFYSNKSQGEKLYDVMEKADYLINAACLKPHLIAGMTLTAKNHFGSIASPTASHLHPYLIVTRGSIPNNSGYHKYRVFVDIMGSKYLGKNTLLYMVDGLFAGGSGETRGPVKYFMPPFNNDWCNSIFLSQDQVALESVCYDFLRSEWNGINKHDASNNSNESNPNWHGVDDHLHQAADPANWPVGIIYDPDKSGKPLTSLGVHEHWNDPVRKQYSRNLGKSTGIELISIPENLVLNETSAVTPKISEQKGPQGMSDNFQKVTASAETMKSSSGSEKQVTAATVVKRPLGKKVKARTFHSATVDDDNTKWYLTESGLVSYDGRKWRLHKKNKNVTGTDLKDIAYEFSSSGGQVWIASPRGATAASLPVGNKTRATTYYKENSPILSDNVVSVAVGKSPLRWFGTDKGISAIRNNEWLTYAYQRQYPEDMFKDFPITAMATSMDGDSLYVATEGGGVARVYRDKVDAISGASEYAQWGPIDMPSDKVYSICIAPDGTQWLGTDLGVARHIGYNTLTNWTVFNTDDGLVNNFVQAIAVDKEGRLWFGTKGGVSVFDGSIWTSFTESNGLNSNNVLCITVDRDGVVWLGTGNGVTSINNGEFTNYN